MTKMTSADLEQMVCAIREVQMTVEHAIESLRLVRCNLDNEIATVLEAAGKGSAGAGCVETIRMQ
jgi:hypothetical protein